MARREVACLEGSDDLIGNIALIPGQRRNILAPREASPYVLVQPRRSRELVRAAVQVEDLVEEGLELRTVHTHASSV